MAAEPCGSMNSNAIAPPHRRPGPSLGRSPIMNITGMSTTLPPPAVPAHFVRGAARWLASIWPSVAVRTDPLAGLLIDGRYTPIPLTGWKLIPTIRDCLLEHRIAPKLTLSSNERLAVIVPVRDREHQVAQFLPKLRAKLDQQGLEYLIVLSEQSQGAPFNKGAVINAGFRAVAGRCDYVCIHDVDTLPLEADYRCPSEPLRLVTQLVGSQQGPRRASRYFGGAISVRCDQFVAANGYSNGYWGWGKEDDDFLFRLLFCGRICFSDEWGKFEDLPNPAHQQINRSRSGQPPTLRANRRRRSKLMRGLTDFREDGLNSLRYSQTEPKAMEGYEHILVTI